MTMALRNIISGMVLLALTAVYGYLTSGLPDRLVPNVPGPSFFPTLIAVSLGVLSLALLGKGIIVGRREGLSLAGLSLPFKAILVLAWFGLFVASLPWAGFIIGGVPFFAGMILFYGERRPHWVVLGAITIPISLFYLFREAFQIMLPTGLWVF